MTAVDTSQLPPNWNENRSAELVAISVLCIVAISVSVSLRLYAQSLTTNPWKIWDSWLTIMASVMAIAVASFILYSVKLGLGYHTTRIILEDPEPPRKLADIFKYAYIQTILQAASIMCTKLAILTLYARVFGLRHHDRFFTYGLYICITFTSLLGVGTTIEFITQCVPPPVFWNRVYLLFPGGAVPNGLTEGYCMDQLTHLVVPVSLDLANEIAILVLPAKVLWSLRLPWKKKLALTITFGLGIFVTITNIVRINIYAKIVNGGDIAWDDIDAFIWTVVQLSVGIICACIPACAPLLKLWSKVSHGYGSSMPLSNHSGASNDRNKRWPKSQSDIAYHRSFEVSYDDQAESVRGLRSEGGNRIEILDSVGDFNDGNRSRV